MAKNNIKRNLDDNVLNIVLKELNRDFIDSLPDTPEVLFTYAKRRVEPEISNNISYNLGKDMLKSRLSDKDYFITFLKVVHLQLSDKNISDCPTAHILLSQTGAGKSNLRTLILKKSTNSVIINSDLFKKLRPDAKRLFEKDPSHFGALTGIDSYDHGSNLNQYAIDKGYNLLIEVAPSKTQGLIGVDIPNLEKHSYEINYHALAVGNLVSSFAIHTRYENDIKNKIKKGETKLTDYGRHNDSYEAMKSILNAIDLNKLHLYKRGDPQNNYLPIRINSSNKIRDFNNLCKLSNDLYVKYQLSKNMPDYNEIKHSMHIRCAPECELNQLETIKKDFNSYKSEMENRKNEEIDFEP